MSAAAAPVPVIVSEVNCKRTCHLVIGAPENVPEDMTDEWSCVAVRFDMHNMAGRQ